MAIEKFALGADISWYPQMLESGFEFRNAEGQKEDLLTILRDYSINTIRLRVFVHPSSDPHNGHCSAEETLELAKKCCKRGFRILLDFHYGDSWCDCGKQPKPAAWEGKNAKELENCVADFTRQTMENFFSQGIVPEWVQIGNETNLGMLLPEGSTDHFEQLVRLYNAGNDAVKAVCPQSKTMIHLSEMSKSDFIIHYFEQLERLKCRYDMIGFSYYPYHLPEMNYTECRNGFIRTLQEVPKRFGKKVMVVEIGGVDEQEEKSYQLMMDAAEDIQRQPECTGLLWWEPEGAQCWSHYPLSAWRNDGTPTHAMDAFQDAAAILLKRKTD